MVSRLGADTRILEKNIRSEESSFCFQVTSSNLLLTGNFYLFIFRNDLINVVLLTIVLGFRSFISPFCS